MKVSISYALRNSRFSGSNALTRSCAAVVTPVRWPVSRSCWRTDVSKVCRVHSILLAIDTTAAHCQGGTRRAAYTPAGSRALALR